MIVGNAVFFVNASHVLCVVLNIVSAAFPVIGYRCCISQQKY